VLDNVEGEIEHIVFRNEENDYTVCRLKVTGRQEPIVAVGILSAVPGEFLSARGFWVNDRKYGTQFKIVEYKAVVPATTKAIERYLGSGLIKGIGPVFAKRMVASFGPETLEVIEKTPDRLGTIEGIGPKRIEKICSAWDAQKEIKTIMLFLQGHGVSTNYAARIYKQYGNGAIAVLRENPYRLAHEVVGIGFVKADQIARNLGIGEDSPLRARAGLLFILNQEVDAGHVFIPEAQLAAKAAELLGIPDPILREALSYLIENNCAIRENGPRKEVYLPPFHVAENGIATRLHALSRGRSPIRPIDAPKAIAWVEEQIGLTLAEEQVRAVTHAATEKGVIITGGPGTGKTTIVRAIVRIFQARRAKILLAAPTGRAAKRLSEASGLPAYTVHRLLGYSPKSGFQKNAEQPLEADVLIVDEVSMVDTLLFYHLLKALPDHAKLILVGDAHQLPSVGAGQVLADLIASEALPTVTLTEIFRQAQKSLIVRNAHRILEGEFPYLPPRSRDASEDFLFVEEEDPERTIEAIRSLVSEEIPGRFGFDPMDDIQVLCPMNRGVAGVINLNRVLQAALNPAGPELKRGPLFFRLGDKVMQITNNYTKGVFNGDIGRIASVDAEEQELTVRFDNGEVPYEFSELDELALGYAVSVHKSQGSEYPAVVLPILAQHYMLLQRNLLYTAVTRAKRLLVLVGTKRAVGMAIGNNRTAQRCTLLQERLRRIRAGAAGRLP
jgi:exodeoxyribonuclease V alpha subunit